MAALSQSRPNSTRASLLLRLRTDGPAREVAWADFYDTYAPIISGFARRLGANGTETDDLVQEVLRAFFAASPEFTYDPARGRFRGYLKTCVWHKVGELRRKRRRDAGADGRPALPDEAIADEVWNDVWETEKLHRALAAVRERYATTPERQRTFRAFELCTLLDRSTEIVAAQLDMSAQSVRKAKERVGTALREAFDHLDSTTG